MNHVYILGGLRSYIGVKDGMYRHIPAEKLGAKMSKWGRKAPPQFGHDKIRMKVSIKVGAESAPKITK